MERNANDHRGSHLKESTDHHIDSVLSEAKQTSKLPINVNDVNLPTLTAVISIDITEKAMITKYFIRCSLPGSVKMMKRKKKMRIGTNYHFLIHRIL